MNNGFVEIIRGGVSLNKIANCFGIYKITCLQNNRSYIGQSGGVIGRVGSHVSSLERGSHSNKELQEDYRLYGANKFVFEFLEQTDDYYNREAYYIALIVMENEDLVYNTTRNVDGRMCFKVARAIDAINGESFECDEEMPGRKLGLPTIETVEVRRGKGGRFAPKE